MGAAATSNTLADYLISIRTRPKERRRRHSFVKRQAPAVGGGPPKLQRRSLAQEIWNAAPSNNSQKKRQSHATIDANRTKRTKRLPSNAKGTSMDTQSASQNGGFQTFQRQSGCTLQPFFTKEDSHVGHQHGPHHQYRFEFSRNVLEDISLNERNAVFESSDLSVISQITQDSSLLEPIDEDKESYFYSSESDEDSEDSDIECMSSDNDDASSSSSSGMNTTYYHRNLGPSSSKRPQEIKTAEVKEGAQLLLDLFSM
jgi:hypothetical protein